MRSATNVADGLRWVGFRRRFDLIVVVPARNEEERIGACLQSVVQAAERARRRIDRFGIVVVADGCTDRTATIARSSLASHPLSSVTECDIGNVAVVRALGVQVGRTQLGERRTERTWIASTDADTTVPNDWLLRHVAAATCGIRAIAGVVDIASFEGLPPYAAQVFEQTYTARLPRDREHSHVHAANLGVRLDAYDEAGGWGCLPRSEDRDLWTRLQQTGARVEARSCLRVVTSGRALGRVAGGFADCLRQQVLDWDHRESARDETSAA